MCLQLVQRCQRSIGKDELITPDNNSIGMVIANVVTQHVFSISSDFFTARLHASRTRDDDNDVTHCVL